MASLPTRTGLKAAAHWLGVEFGVRSLGAGFLTGILAVLFSIPLVSGTAFIISLIALTVAMLLLGLLFRARVEREGLAWTTLGYTAITRPIVIAGLVAGMLDITFVILVTDPLDTLVFPEGQKVAADLMRMVKEAGVVPASYLVLSNGLFGPIVEEFAWRGYIQTKLQPHR